MIVEVTVKISMLAPSQAEAITEVSSRLCKDLHEDDWNLQIEEIESRKAKDKK